MRMPAPKRSDAATPAVLSRREAIIGALALAAGTLVATRPETAGAVDGQTIVVGGHYSSSGDTFLMRTFDGGIFSPAWSAAGLTFNDGTLHYGVDGQSFAGDPGSAGVHGHTGTAGHFGVLARHTASGKALRVEGAASFSRSGKATILKGHASRTVTGLSNITADSIILVTLQGSAGSGNHFRWAKRLSSTSFQVVLTKTASVNVAFGWLILD